MAGGYSFIPFKRVEPTEAEKLQEFVREKWKHMYELDGSNIFVQLVSKNNKHMFQIMFKIPVEEYMMYKISGMLSELEKTMLLRISLNGKKVEIIHENP